MRRRNYAREEARKVEEYKVVRDEPPITKVRHNGKICPYFAKDLHVTPPSYPTDHPLWEDFKVWVKTGGVVRSDLLEMRDMDWRIMWCTYIAHHDHLLCGTSH